MAIKGLLIHKCDVWRKQKVEGKGLTSAFVKIGENIPCLVLPQTQEDNLSANITIGKDYSAYFNSEADVEEGDKLVCNELGLSLFVNGKAPYVKFPRIDHKEYSCQTTGD